MLVLVLVLVLVLWGRTGRRLRMGWHACRLGLERASSARTEVQAQCARSAVLGVVGLGMGSRVRARVRVRVLVGC